MDPESRPRIEAPEIQRELRSLVAPLVYYIQRAWPGNRWPEAHGWAAIKTSLEMAYHYWTFEAFMLYTSENPVAGWRDEHSLVMPLVDRALLETACNVIFLLEDLASRARTFNQAGWKDAYTEIVRVAASVDPEDEAMQRYVRKKQAFLEQGRLLFQITDEQMAEVHNIEGWPSLKTMKTWGLKKGAEVPTSRLLIRHLVEHFYKELSGVAHGDGFAQFTVGAFAMASQMTQEQRELLREDAFPMLRSTSLLRASAFLLCIVSEVKLYLNYQEDQMAARIFHVWGLLSKQVEIKELFEVRYKEKYPFVLI